MPLCVFQFQIAARRRIYCRARVRRCESILLAKTAGKMLVANLLRDTAAMIAIKIKT